MTWCPDCTGELNWRTLTFMDGRPDREVMVCAGCGAMFDLVQIGITPKQTKVTSASLEIDADGTWRVRTEVSDEDA